MHWFIMKCVCNFQQSKIIVNHCNFWAGNTFLHFNFPKIPKKGKLKFLE